jgi:hypothetical protein
VALLVPTARATSSAVSRPSFINSRDGTNFSGVAEEGLPPTLPRAGGCEPGGGALNDDLPLELADGADDREEQLSAKVVAAMPSLSDRNCTPRLAEAVNHVQKVPEAAPQTVEPPDHQHVTLADALQRAGQLRAVLPGPGRLLHEDLRATCRRKRVDLQVEVLLDGRAPHVAHVAHSEGSVSIKPLVPSARR